MAINQNNIIYTIIESTGWSKNFGKELARFGMVNVHMQVH